MRPCDTVAKRPLPRALYGSFEIFKILSLNLIPWACNSGTVKRNQNELPGL